MKVLISGASGLVGTALSKALTAQGHVVTALVRAKSGKAREILWAPEKSELNGAELEGFDAVVHLSGENIAARRWSKEQKAKILNSRVQGTRLLAEKLARLNKRPAVLVCASATGYYGDRGNEELTEESPPGKGFLPDVCKQWEGAAKAAKEAGIRTVHLRFGVIFSRNGGALAKMTTPFKLGVAGRIGSGEQYMSWVTLDDAVNAAIHAIKAETLHGPVNVVAPQAVTNLEFTKAMGRAVHRPTVLPMPAFMARLVMGEMADDLLLASTRVAPRVLERSGFRFQHPDLDEALQHALSH